MPPVHVIGHGAIGSLMLANGQLQNMAMSAYVRNASSVTKTVVTLDQQIVSLPSPVLRVTPLPQHCIIVVPVKAYQVEAVLNDLAKHITHNHTAVLMHNGMGSQTLVSKLLPHHAIYYATTSYAAKKDKQQVCVTGHGQTYLGPATALAQQDIERGKQVEDILSALLPPVTYCHDIEQILWQKLVINACINPLTAIYKVNNGGLLDSVYQPAVEQLILQCFNVMQALQMTASLSQLRQSVYTVIEQTANNHSSMYQDIKHKRPTEIDFINGYVVQQGLKTGVDVSAHQDAMLKIRQMEAKYL
ncbi:ketopantoate reductase family protein [Alteromonas sediminis]|nr:2-dehydropantoate 2-reductase [Alteromonas sediminis]